jgi:hypothetical protein
MHALKFDANRTVCYYHACKPIGLQFLKKGGNTMGTYDHKQILSDYESGRMTVEMAMGHSLQHIDKLYELQTTANVNRYEMRGKIDTLENRANILQKEVARLAALVEKFLPKRKQKSSDKSQKDQP